jgi:WD40-like Beta Propeller Repeat
MKSLSFQSVGRKSVARTGLLFALVLAGLTMGSAANDSSRPIIFVADGDVWKSSGTTSQRLTSWAHNWGPSLSANGRFVVYGSDARLAVGTCKQRDDCGHVSLPANVWLRDLNTGASRRIADQPKGDPIKVGIRRSRPIWSPDGSSFAWTEIRGNRYRLALHSLASGKTEFKRLFISLPGSGNSEDSGVFVPDPIIWSEAGIVLPVPTSQGSNSYSSALILGPNLGPNLGPDRSFRRLLFPHEISGWLVFAKDGDRTLITGHKADFVIDPSTGITGTLEGKLEQYIPGASDGLSVVASSGCELYRGETLLKPLPTSNNELFGCDTNIAPDGSSVAYSEDDSLVIDDGRATKQLVTAKDYVSAWEWGRHGFRIKR